VTDDDMVRWLSQDDPDLVLSALAEVGAQREREPSEEVVRACVELFFHDDPDVRHDAVAAIALHWGVRDSAGALVSMLAGEQDDYVLEVVIRALGRLGREHSDLLSVVGPALARGALPGSIPENLRKLAYVEALSLYERADVASRVAVALDPASTILDEAWLRQLAGLAKD